MTIRKAVPKDVAVLAQLTSVCFLPEEAISEEQIAERFKIYPEHFWILEDRGKIVAYINGMATDQLTIQDEMFYNPNLHENNGSWQTILGVNTDPEYRKRGYAGKLMEQVIADAKKKGRKGCILTCKKELIHYYEKFGFKDEGISKSSLTGAIWYDMRLEF